MTVAEYCKGHEGSQTVSETDLNVSELEKMKEAVNLLIQTRPLLKISDTNKHVFCSVSERRTDYIRGSDVIQDFCNRSSAKRPEALRSTKLRQQVATMTHILNLKDNELGILANFMGHDVKVHPEYYRFRDQIVQVAKVSKFVHAVERGEPGNYEGQSLQDIPVPNDELDSKYIKCSYKVGQISSKTLETNFLQSVMKEIRYMSMGMRTRMETQQDLRALLKTAF